MRLETFGVKGFIQCYMVGQLWIFASVRCPTGTYYRGILHWKWAYWHWSLCSRTWGTSCGPWSNLRVNISVTGVSNDPEDWRIRNSRMIQRVVYFIDEISEAAAVIFPYYRGRVRAVRLNLWSGDQIARSRRHARKVTTIPARWLLRPISADEKRAFN